MPFSEENLRDFQAHQQAKAQPQAPSPVTAPVPAPAPAPAPAPVTAPAPTPATTQASVSVSATAPTPAHATVLTPAPAPVPAPVSTSASVPIQTSVPAHTLVSGMHSTSHSSLSNNDQTIRDLVSSVNQLNTTMLSLFQLVSYQKKKIDDLHHFASTVNPRKSSNGKRTSVSP